MASGREPEGVPPEIKRLDAFISYSHAADSKLAVALDYQLQKFAKPWYRIRSANVFRDGTNLASDPHLWPTIASSLSESAFVIQR